jgi:2-polyprenyl-6-methoxyphenol hydroxylase-like FAD-dependent oxidoreductase
MTPNLGQGACQAIEDAVALAEGVSRGKDAPAALALYEERRKGRAAMIVRRSRAFARVAQAENPLLCALRNAMVGIVPPRMSLRQLAPVLDPEA